MGARLKFIPRFLDAPFAVRHGVPEIPTIVGKKFPVSWFAGEDYLEGSFNIVCTPSGRRIINLLSGSSKYLCLEVHVLIEGQTEEELPERILGGFSIFRVDLD